MNKIKKAEKCLDKVLKEGQDMTDLMLMHELETEWFDIDPEMVILTHMEDFLERENRPLCLQQNPSYIRKGHFNFSFDVRTAPESELYFQYKYQVIVNIPEKKYFYRKDIYEETAVLKKFFGQSYCVVFQNGEYYFAANNEKQFHMDRALMRRFLLQYRVPTIHPKAHRQEFNNLITSAIYIDARWDSFRAGDCLGTFEKEAYARIPICASKIKYHYSEYIENSRKKIYPFTFQNHQPSEALENEEEEEEENEEEGGCMFCDPGECYGHSIGLEWRKETGVTQVVFRDDDDYSRWIEYGFDGKEEERENVKYAKEWSREYCDELRSRIEEEERENEEECAYCEPDICCNICERYKELTGIK